MHWVFFALCRLSPVTAWAFHFCGFSCYRAQILDTWASVVTACRLSSCGHTGLVAPQHVESSLTRNWTHVPCIGRQILIHCTTREVCAESLLLWAGFLELRWARTSHCGGFSCGGFKCAGSGVVVQGFSCSVACGIFLDRNRTRVPCIGRWILNHWTTRKSCIILTLLVRIAKTRLWGSHSKNGWCLSWLFYSLPSGALAGIGIFLHKSSGRLLEFQAVFRM